MNVYMCVCVCVVRRRRRRICSLWWHSPATPPTDNQDVRLVRGVADTIGKAVAGGVQVGAGCTLWHLQG